MSNSGVSPGQASRGANIAEFQPDYFEAMQLRAEKKTFRQPFNKFIAKHLHEVHMGPGAFHLELPQRRLLAGCKVGTRSPSVRQLFSLAKQAFEGKAAARLQLNGNHIMVVSFPAGVPATIPAQWGRLTLQAALGCSTPEALNTFIKNKPLLECLSRGGQGSDELQLQQPELVPLLKLQYNNAPAYQLYWRLLCLAGKAITRLPSRAQLTSKLRELQSLVISMPHDEQWVLLGLDMFTMLFGMGEAVREEPVQTRGAKRASALTALVQAQKVAAASAAPAAAPAASPRVASQLTPRVSAPIPLSLVAEVPQLASISGPGSLASPVAVEPPVQCPRPCCAPAAATAATTTAVATIINAAATVIPSATTILPASGSTTAKAASKKRSKMSWLLRLLTWGCGVAR